MVALVSGVFVAPCATWGRIWLDETINELGGAPVDTWSDEAETLLWVIV